MDASPEVDVILAVDAEMKGEYGWGRLMRFARLNQTQLSDGFGFDRNPGQHYL